MKSEDKCKPDSFSQKIGIKEERKLKAQRNRRSIWSGFSVFGMVGWSVVIPILLGTILGLWLDKKYPQPYSWTLTFLFLGLISGCLAAWYWIDKENKEMNKNCNKKENKNE